MYQYLTENAGNLLAVRTTGKLDPSDLDTLLPAIKEKIKQHGKIRFFWELDAFEGWTPAAFVEDRFFELKHFNDFSRIAIVGEKKWEEKMASLMKPFTTAELKYFDTSQRQQALQWVQES